jgi:hypothetical protein
MSNVRRHNNKPQMIDELVPQIEEVQAQGAVVLLKWDGERAHNRCTVVVTRQDTDYAWRKDCSDIEATLIEALLDYRTRHAH